MLHFTDEIIGHFVYEEKEGREWDIQIRKGNCLCVMTYYMKDENNELSLGLFNFYADEKHIKNILRNRNKLCTGIKNCVLNIKHKEARTLLKYFAKEITVEVYDK